jgi:hypothetical protein
MMNQVGASRVRSDGMSRRSFRFHPVALFLTAMVLVNCQTQFRPADVSERIRSFGHVWTIPDDVQRIAVFYPRSSNPDFTEAYRWLEGAAFQLKKQRPALRIVDRANVPMLRSEQQFQSGGAVTDEGAVRAGQLLGVDSVLLYAIDGPTWRDRLMADRPSGMRPVTVTSKIVRVETAEVIYHNVVTARMHDGDHRDWSLLDRIDVQELGREALEHGIRQTMSDLQRAFQ